MNGPECTCLHAHSPTHPHLLFTSYDDAPDIYTFCKVMIPFIGSLCTDMSGEGKSFRETLFQFNAKALYSVFSVVLITGSVGVEETFADNSAFCK